MASRHDVIIGGTKGIGRALARSWSEKGHQVTVVGRNTPSWNHPQGGICFLAGDLTDLPPLLDRLKSRISQSGLVNRLVFLQRFRGTSDPWIGELQVSLTATKTLIEYCADSFDPDGGKAIAVVSSNACQFVGHNQPVGYHVAKAGLVQMIRYYAVKLGARGIRVNAVSCSAFVKEESRLHYKNHPELRELYQKITPLGRLGTAEEVAQVIDFLCSPGASFITGQNLFVDGGLSLPLHDSLALEWSTPKRSAS